MGARLSIERKFYPSKSVEDVHPYKTRVFEWNEDGSCLLITGVFNHTAIRQHILYDVDDDHVFCRLPASPGDVLKLLGSTAAVLWLSSEPNTLTYFDLNMRANQNSRAVEDLHNKFELPAHTEVPLADNFSKDGRFLLLRNEPKNEVHLVSVEHRRVVRTYAGVAHARFSADGARLLLFRDKVEESSSQEGATQAETTTLQDVKVKRLAPSDPLVQRMSKVDHVEIINRGDSGSTLTADNVDQAYATSVRTYDIRRNFEGACIVNADVNPVGTHFILTYGDKTVQVYSLETGESVLNDSLSVPIHYLSKRKSSNIKLLWWSPTHCVLVPTDVFGHATMTWIDVAHSTFQQCRFVDDEAQASQIRHVLDVDTSLRDGLLAVHFQTGDQNRFINVLDMKTVSDTAPQPRSLSLFKTKNKGKKLRFHPTKPLLGVGKNGINVVFYSLPAQQQQ